MNKFDQWFKAQYGRLPNSTHRLKMECKILEMRTRANFMEQNTEQMKAIELRYESAKKAFYSNVK